MNQLTQADFDKFNPGEFITSGTTTDDQNGINISNSGKPLKWIAVKRTGNDWTLHYHWAHLPDSFIISNGVKLSVKQIVRRLFPCTDAVLNNLKF